MKALINNQKIRIDNHNAGQIVKYEGIHIHKTSFNRTISGKKIGSIDIIIPFQPNKNVSVRHKRLKDEDKKRLFEQIKNEINEAFKNNRNRTGFVEDLISSVRKFSERKDVITNIITAAQTLAKHFDLNEEIKSEILVKVENEIKNLITIHQELNGENLYYINQSDEFVEIGQLKDNSKIHNILSNNF